MHAIALAGPAVEPVTLAEIRTYLRVDDTSEDDLLAALAMAARRTVEAAARIALVSQAWRVSLPRVPRGGVVALPLAPILSVDAVHLVTAGGTSEVPAEHYAIDLGTEPARVTLDPDAIVAGASVRGLTVDVTAGFGPAPSDVPQPIRLAILRLAARWYAERGDGARASVGPLDPDIAALVAPYTRPRLA